MAKENKNEIGEMRIPTDELIKEYLEHDPRAPKWARELMENLMKNG